MPLDLSKLLKEQKDYKFLVPKVNAMMNNNEPTKLPQINFEKFSDETPLNDDFDL